MKGAIWNFDFTSIDSKSYVELYLRNEQGSLGPLYVKVPKYRYIIKKARKRKDAASIVKKIKEQVPDTKTSIKENDDGNYVVHLRGNEELKRFLQNNKQYKFDSVSNIDFFRVAQPLPVPEVEIEPVLHTSLSILRQINDLLFENLRKGKKPDLKRVESRKRMIETMLKKYGAKVIIKNKQSARLVLDDHGALKPLNTSANLEALVEGNVGSIDIETKDYLTPNPIIYSDSLVSDKGDHVLSIYDIAQKRISSESGRKAKFVKCDSEDDLRLKLTAFMRDADLAVIGGQNIIGFDYNNLAKRLKIGDKGDNFFCPTIDNRELRKLPGKKGDNVKLKIATTNDLDTMYVADNYLKCLLCDSKLESIAELCDVFFPDVNFDFVKSHSYGQIDEMVEQSEKGEIKPAFDLNQYNYDDTIMHYRLTKLFLPIMCNIAVAAEATPFEAFNSYKKRLAVHLGNRLHFRRTKKIRRDWQYLNFKRGSLVHLPEIQTGLLRNHQVVFFPLYKAFEDFLPKTAGIQNLYDKLEKSNNPIEKIIYIQFLNSFVDEILYDINNIKYDFEKKYGCSPAKVEKKYSENLENLLKPLEDRVVNHSNGLMFLSKHTSGVENFGYVDFGLADIISVAQGKVIFKKNDLILSSGIKIPSKKQRKSMDYKNGPFCNLEKRIIRDFIETAFVDQEKALDQLRIDLLNIRKSKITDFIYRINVKKDLDDLSIKQQESSRNKRVEWLGGQVGDRLFDVMTDDGRSIGYDPLKKSFYYFDGERKYVDHDGLKFGNGISVDIDSYSNLFLDKKRNFGKICKAIYGEDAIYS